MVMNFYAGCLIRAGFVPKKLMQMWGVSCHATPNDAVEQLSV